MASLSVLQTIPDRGWDEGHRRRGQKKARCKNGSPCAHSLSQQGAKIDTQYLLTLRPTYARHAVPDASAAATPYHHGVALLFRRTRSRTPTIADTVCSHNMDARRRTTTDTARLAALSRHMLYKIVNGEIKQLTVFLTRT